MENKKLIIINQKDGKLILPGEEVKNTISVIMSQSPAKKIRFSDGVVMELNRKERRKHKLYNWKLTKPGKP